MIPSIQSESLYKRSYRRFIEYPIIQAYLADMMLALFKIMQKLTETYQKTFVSVIGEQPMKCEFRKECRCIVSLMMG
jgi:hypothetical protein